MKGKHWKSPTTTWSKSEREALKAELKRQVAEMDEKYSNEVDVLILYTLRVTEGWGKTKLRRFYDAFIANHKQLREDYLLDREGVVWLAARELKRIGVDVEAWNAGKYDPQEEPPEGAKT